MSKTKDSKNARPEFKNLNLFHDVVTYRLPLAGIVSITHRITGVILFFSMPFWIWLFDKTISSAAEFAEFIDFFHNGWLFFPWWLVKIAAVILMFIAFHYTFAGLRHVYIEVTHKTSKKFGRRSALATFACSIGCTLIFVLYSLLG